MSNEGRAHTIYADLTSGVGPANGRDSLCTICQDEMLSNDTTTTHTTCGNSWHRPCLNAALRHRNRCPTCRVVLQLREGMTPDQNLLAQQRANNATGGLGSALRIRAESGFTLNTRAAAVYSATIRRREDAFDMTLDAEMNMIETQIETSILSFRERRPIQRLWLREKLTKHVIGMFDQIIQIYPLPDDFDFWYGLWRTPTNAMLKLASLFDEFFKRASEWVVTFQYLRSKRHRYDFLLQR